MTTPDTNTVEIITDMEGLKGLKTEWDQLAPPREVEPWQSFIWVEAAASAYGKNDSLRVITVRKHGKLTAVAPMVLKLSQQPLRPVRLDFVGGEELKEPNRFISLDSASVNSLLDAIVSEHGCSIRLSRIPDDQEAVNAITSKFMKARWVTRILRMPYPYLDLGVNPIKKSLKEDLRRARRKASEHGEVRSQIISPVNEQELLQHLQTGLKIEASGWKGRNGTAILCNEFRKKFFERYACSAWKEGMLRMHFLYVDTVPVAFQLAVESAKAYWLLNVAYDEDYQRCSPGNLLLGESIEDAARNGVVRYNLLGKDEPWIRHWTTTTQDTLVLAAYRPNVTGLKAIMSDALYLVKKQMQKRQKEAVKKVQHQVTTGPMGTC